MTIQEALQNILQAVFGKDVRQSIHDGIDAINKESKADMEAKQETINIYTAKQDALDEKYNRLLDEMSKADPSLAEVVDSRQNASGVIYENLKERLDTTDTVIIENKTIFDDNKSYTESELGNMSNKIGDISNLATSQKNNLVIAVNELKTAINQINTNIASINTDIGKINTNHNNLVKRVDADVSSLGRSMGVVQADVQEALVLIHKYHG